MSLAAETALPTSHIHVHTRYIPPPEPSLPALAVQITQLVDSYMLWVGTTTEPPESVQNAPMQGSLARDWACAMPAREMNSSMPPAATSLFRTSSSDVALAMSQHLGDRPSFLAIPTYTDCARRFKKQIFLSVDIPPSFQTMGQGPPLILAVEKTMVETLKELEQTRT